MKKLVFGTIACMAAILAAAPNPSVAEDGCADECCDTAQWYTGASVSMLIPQGGGSMRRLGGSTVRAGRYLTETFAVEADAAWLENAAGLGLQGLWHFWGYERFDPFLTFGARGWIDGDAGGVTGIGAFYHLTDNWSLRGDAQATLGIDGECDMLYSVGLGVQYTF